VVKAVGGGKRSVSIDPTCADTSIGLPLPHPIEMVGLACSVVLRQRTAQHAQTGSKLSVDACCAQWRCVIGVKLRRRVAGHVSKDELGLDKRNKYSFVRRCMRSFTMAFS
jgi:hypothetical protein